MSRAGALILLLGACAPVAGAPVAGAPDAGGIVLDAGGLSPAGSALRVDFGRHRTGAVDAVSRLVGAGPASASACGEGVEEVRWANGLALTFRDAAFSGWITRAGRGRPAVTAGGLGPGAPEAPLPEGLSARFESGVIVALSAGAPCIRG